MTLGCKYHGHRLYLSLQSQTLEKFAGTVTSLSRKSGLSGNQLPRPHLFLLFLYTELPTLNLQDGNCFVLTGN